MENRVDLTTDGTDRTDGENREWTLMDANIVRVYSRLFAVFFSRVVRAESTVL